MGLSKGCYLIVIKSSPSQLIKIAKVVTPPCIIRRLVLLYINHFYRITPYGMSAIETSI